MPTVQQDHLSVPSAFASTSSWHQISPSTRPLNLEILEITSLSLTIALSLAPRPQPQQQLRHTVSQRSSQNQLNGAYTSNQARSRKGNRTRARSTDSDEELTAVEDNESPYPSSSSSTNAIAQLDSPGQSNLSSAIPGSYSSSSARPAISPLVPHPSFKDLLSKGVVVTVNGKPWTMIVAHVDEDETPLTDRTGISQGESSGAADSSSSSPPRSSSVTKGRRKTEDAEGAAGTGADDESWLASSDAGNDRERREMDRAIVVIYGLEPGKEYEVDLKVIGNLNCGETGNTSSASVTASTSIITPAVHAGVSSGNRSRANSLRSRPNGTRSRSSSLIQSAAVTSGATIGGGRTPSDGAIVAGLADFASNATIAAGQRRQSREVVDGPVQESSGAVGGSGMERAGQDDIRANHLRHLVQTATGEKEDLSAQLKKSRRESQKAEAALRSDIEALKKAMEKTTLPDQRSRQKSLALQEQVKQALAGAVEADKEQRLIEQGMDHLASQEGEVKEEWEQAREERDKANVEREKAMEEAKKAMAELDLELAAIVSKLEKQQAKRDRILRDNQDLQQKLEDVASARSEVEKRNDAINRQRMLAEDYPNVLAHSSIGRPPSGTSGGWDNDDVWTVNPAAASRPNAGRGSIGASAINTAFGAQTGISAQPSYSSSDLHQLGRQAGPSYNARPFWPSSGGMPRATSGPSMPPVAAAALATQGIPKAATMGISHMGNPTGFFPVAAASSASSAAASLGRKYQNRPPGTSAAIGSISPLVANVNAAPFMPAQPPGVTGDQSRQSSSSSDQHTSLVPPQLQHRIFLPGNRRVLSPSTTGQGTSSNAIVYTGKPNGTSNDQAQGSTTTPPAFPPLPSSKTAAIPPGPFKANMSPGPSLASIVTRAIIPNNSVLHAGNQAAQQSPVHQHADLQSMNHGARPSPPSSRPSSFYGRAEPGDMGFGPKVLLTPQGEDSDHFPPLPISPVNAWGSASAASTTPTANNAKVSMPVTHSLNVQGSTGPWAGKVPSRRGSESAGFSS